MNLPNPTRYISSFQLLAAALLAVLILNVQSASADLITLEDFDSYSAGTGLVGLNGGTGFGGAWTGSGFSTVDNGSGNSATGSSGNTRLLGTAATDIFSSNTGEIWLSFEFTSTSADNTFAGLNLYQGGTERVLIGKNSFTGQANNNTNWMIARDSNLGDVSGVSFLSNKKGVVRFNLAAGSGGSADLWIGTAGEYVDVSAPEDASMSSLTLSGIDRIAFRGNAVSTMDSFMLGTTNFDVNAVPEPTSLTLFGIGVVGLIGRRRRR